MQTESEQEQYRLVGGPFDGGTCKGKTPFVLKPIPKESGNVQKFAIYGEVKEIVTVLNVEKVTHYRFIKSCSERDIIEVMEELDPDLEENNKDAE